jgi:hypothetical protein
MASSPVAAMTWNSSLRSPPMAPLSAARHGSAGRSGRRCAVGIGHDLVAGLGAIEVAIEAVGVLHDELAAAHQAEARTPLVAELGLDLVEVLRQLLVAADFLARDVGDDFFAGGLDHEVTVMPVLDAQQLGPILTKRPVSCQNSAGCTTGISEFDRAGAVHFLAHDRLDLADHPQPHRHVRVDAGAELLDHARAHHELMARDLGVGRRFLEGGNEESGKLSSGSGREVGRGTTGETLRAWHGRLPCNPACIIGLSSKIGV